MAAAIEVPCSRSGDPVFARIGARKVLHRSLMEDFNSLRKERCLGAKAEAGSTARSSAPKCRHLGRYVAINVNDEK
jgi:hypothetical protein